MTAAQAGSSDMFFYYDSVPVSDQILASVFEAILQPPGTLSYNRSYGCDVSEGAPNSFSTELALRSGIVAALSLRNTRVADGRNGLPDRRAATSFNAVSFSRDPADGSLEIQVQYVELGDLSQMKKATVPGVGR